MFKKVKKTASTSRIAPVDLLDVLNFQETTISVAVEISGSIPGLSMFDKESRLKVRITNAGEKTASNLSIEAHAPGDVILADPGILFGNARRHVRLPRLEPSKSITYKISLRASGQFTGGFLDLIISDRNYDSPRSETIKIPLRAI